MKTSVRMWRSVFATAAIAIATSAVAGAQYTFVPVPPPVPHLQDLQFTAISNNNTIVGSFGQKIGHVGKSRTVGFIYQAGSTGPWTILQDTEGNLSNTVATGVNSDGIVVGWYSKTANKDYAMIYDGGNYSSFAVSGCTDTYYNGINDAGNISGYCIKGTTYPAFYTDSTGLAEFTVPGAVNLYTYGIDNMTDVVGTYETGSPADRTTASCARRTGTFKPSIFQAPWSHGLPA